MSKWMPLTAAAACLMLGACGKGETPAAPTTVSEAEVSKAWSDTLAAWASMDAGKIKALYAPNVAGFDFASGPMVSDRATWDKNQEAYAAMKIDGVKVIGDNKQVLDASTFIVSSLTEDTSSTLPKSNGFVRCTDVFHRQADGKFMIVNEHCSAMPVPPAKPAPPAKPE